MTDYKLSSDLEIRLAQKRLIFTVTTGRSGTRYLSRILSFVPGIASFHEPAPSFTTYMRPSQENPEVAYRFWLEEKLPFISKIPQTIYAETSHLFCKGFAKPLIGLGIHADIIILKRDHRAVAQSLYSLNTIPGRTESGRKYYLSPDDPDVLPISNWYKLHDYQLCYWYCLEIERRSKELQRLFKQEENRISQVTIADLNNLKHARKLLDQLQLPNYDLLGAFNFYLRRFYKGWSRNYKDKERTNKIVPSNLEELEQEVNALVNQ